MDGIRIVFFDAGQTLLRTRERVGEVYARAARRQGLDVEPGPVEAAFREVFLAHRHGDRPQSRGWWREVVGATFARFGTARDGGALFEELYGYFTNPSSWSLMPGASDTLETLRARGYRTGLISNWDDRLPSLLRGLGLDARLDPIVVSCRVGVEKPHPRIFETALAEAGEEAGRALMVGDDPEADVRGARAVGMAAVLFDEGGEAGSDGDRIRALADLLRLLPSAVPGRESAAGPRKA